MNLYVYSDESGVLDRDHNKIYVFGGLVCATAEQRDIYARKYLHAEKAVREREGIAIKEEVKASKVGIKSRRSLYRSLNALQKFGVVVIQDRLNENIFNSKKSKQRFLDYAYKIAARRKIEQLIRDGILNPAHVDNIYFCVDQHTTATDGKYELKEALEQEFKYGTFNYNFDVFYPPIFPKTVNIDLKYCDSKSKPLIRAADIIANRIFYNARTDTLDELRDEKTNIIILPY